MLHFTAQESDGSDRNGWSASVERSIQDYILAGSPNEQPEVILIATGSEVSLCVQAFEQLASEGIKARVVSLPSWELFTRPSELFTRQSQEYRDSVLPPNVSARVAVEQGSTLGWERWVGPQGHIIGMESFGSSAPLKDLQKKFGFLSESVAQAAKRVLNR